MKICKFPEKLASQMHLRLPILKIFKKKKKLLIIKHDQPLLFKVFFNFIFMFLITLNIKGSFLYLNM